MRSLRFTGIVLLTGIFAVGCSDQTAPTTPGALAEDGLSTGDPSLDSRTRNPVIHQAAANWTNTNAGPEGPRKFHFSAYEHADGTTRGRMYVNNPNSSIGLLVARTDVQCITQMSEDMWVFMGVVKSHGGNGIITPPAGFPPASEGDWAMLWFAEDHGQGPAVDRLTATASTTVAVAGLVCANPAAFGVTPGFVEAQVNRDGSPFIQNVEAGFVRIRQY